MSHANAIQAADGLFADTPDGPRLLGSRCTACETAYFPRSGACHNPDCPGSRIEDACFGPSGTLWSVAIQNYPPPPPAVIPEPYTPYAIGLVDLPEGLRVLGRLAVDDPLSVEVGTAMELVLAPLGQNEAGQDVVSWQFKPA
jgi:uncharacterized OB-fold protein